MGRKSRCPRADQSFSSRARASRCCRGNITRWIAVDGTGPVMLFEVSTTNDDTMDNRFHTAKGRLPEIEEDETPQYLIFQDYQKYVKL